MSFLADYPFISQPNNRLWNGGTGVGTVPLYERHVGGERLIDAAWAENIGCEYGEYC